MKRIVLFADTSFNAENNVYTKNASVHNAYTKNASVLRLAAQLRKRGHLVKTVYNFTSFTVDEIDYILESFSENKKHELVIGISTSFLAGMASNNKFKDSSEFIVNSNFWGDAYKSILSLCIIAKKKYKAVVVMGGWVLGYRRGGNLVSRDVIIFKNNVDYFIIGDGTDCLNKIATNQNVNFQIEEDYKVVIGEAIKDFTDQHSMPIIEDYVADKESLVTELASGCIFSCSFCDYGSLGKKKNEFVRSYDSLKKEFEHNYKNFGTYVYQFSDNIMNDYIIKLEMLKRIRDELKIELRWTGFARLDTIKNEKQAQMIKDSGAAGVSFGIESMHKSVGPYIGKMTDGEKIKDCLRMCRNVFGDDVVVTASFISGLPTETPDILYNNYKFLISNEGRHLIDTYTFARLFIVPANKDKNAINIARGDPFAEYEISSSIKWKSPWGDSKIFAKMGAMFDKNGNRDFSIFKIPVIHNSYEPLEKLVKIIRSSDKKTPFDSKKFNENSQKNIQLYKNKMLNN